MLGQKIKAELEAMEWAEFMLTPTLLIRTIHHMTILFTLSFAAAVGTMARTPERLR
jgi:hypothetical protein